jgi:uncharacterized sulfatase
MMGNKDKYPKLYEAGFGKRPEEELFDVKKDPDCMNNLAENPQFATNKKQLKEQLMFTLKQQGDPRALGYGDVFESYPRFGSMRPPLGGFAERTKYNPKYQKLAEEAKKKLGISNK